MEKDLYDIIIIGAGPAGLTAGLYTSRRALKTLILSKDLGGQAGISAEIENYPGIDFTDGASLMQKFSEQARKFGTEIKYHEVTDIKKEKNEFLATADQQNFRARTLILAFGLLPRHLNIPGEKEFKGKGVTYCATCDGPLYKNKIVAIIGGGNSALEAAEYLSGITAKVYLIHRGNKFTDERILAKEIKKNPKIEIILNSEATAIKGSQLVESVVVKNNKDDQVQKINVNGVFIEIGYSAKTEFIRKLVKVNKKGEIITDKNANTSQSGVFACGDVTDSTYKQIVISAGEGAKAALQAYKYIQLHHGEEILPDWRQTKY